MGISSSVARQIASGHSEGQKALDDFNPTALGVGDATPVTTQAALTAAAGGSANSGDGGTDTIIEANRTRLAEIEAALIAFGIVLT